MEFWHALVLGIIQGLTEFIPVSSSGHLVLAEYFFGLNNASENLLFNIMLHLGSLLAILLYFHQTIIDILSTNKKMFMLLIIATIPAGIAGIFLKPLIESFMGNPLLICLFLLLTGAFLFVAEKKASNTYDATHTSPWQALCIGFVQIFAILPGISRSGSTIGTALFTGMKRADAVTFSFLLAIPLIAGAGLLEMKDLIKDKVIIDLVPISIGIVSSFVSSLIAIRIVAILAEQKKLIWFSIYCASAGMVGIAYFTIQLI